MYKNKFVSELSINEVKKYFDELRFKFPWTAEESKDFAICRERLIVQACKELEQINVLDKIKAEIMRLTNGDIPEQIWNDDVLEIIDKYKTESEDI